MANRPTIEQVALASGVSVATVDRVLNRRAHVRPKTAKRVHEAAVEIGYHASGLIGRRLREELPEYRMGFLLLDTGQAFYDEFARQLAQAVAEASDFRGVFMLDRASPRAPEQIAQKLLALSARCMAVAVVAPEHPAVSAAVAGCADRGIPVFALLSDVAPGYRRAYVGVHNGKVGRTAAWMIANAARAPGKVAVFVGSHRFHGHEAREMGFRAFFREEAPGFSVIETLVNFEDARFTEDALLDLVARHPDFVGCYVAGGGMEGAVAAMRAVEPGRRPVMICNELTPLSSIALSDRSITMVIDTPVRAISREVVRQMAQSLSGKGGRAGDCYLPFGIHLPESV
ncbi:MAG: LacI family DNA-binding transcriptional regulator [Hyphomicrobiales bacterium]|nr:LacI family DNA-binding transcriptional regulator [Hyphomicrobiales bacterium]